MQRFATLLSQVRHRSVPRETAAFHVRRLINARFQAAYLPPHRLPLLFSPDGFFVALGLSFSLPYNASLSQRLATVVRCIISVARNGALALMDNARSLLVSLCKSARAVSLALLPISFFQIRGVAIHLLCALEANLQRTETQE